jgi:trehalose 6-phosphate synthase
LPIVLSKNENNEWTIEAGSGGLVTALVPVLKNRGGIWIGWTGNVEEEGILTRSLFEKEKKKIGFTLKPVNLNQHEKDNYYKGFANEVLWPLFHDFVAHCHFNPLYWEAYRGKTPSLGKIY